MRFIGNKENILDNIYSILEKNSVRGKTFFDFFAGTTNVSRFFKKKGRLLLSEVKLLFWRTIMGLFGLVALGLTRGLF